MSNQLQVDASAVQMMKSAKKHWAEANKHAEKAIAAYIRVGDSLNAARGYFPGDKEFGQYRAQVMPEISAKWAGDLMRIAAMHKRRELPNTTISVLKEIATASDDVIDTVAERVEDGGKVTVKEARELVKAERTPEYEHVGDGDIIEDTAPPAPVATDAPSTPDPVRVADPEPEAPRTAREKDPKYEKDPALVMQEEERKLLDLPVEERLNEADNFWNMVGLSQFSDNLPSDDTIFILYDYFCSKYPDFKGRIIAAYKRDAE